VNSLLFNAVTIKSPVTSATKKNFSFPLITAPPIPNPQTPTAETAIVIVTVSVTEIGIVTETEKGIEIEIETGKENEIGKGKGIEIEITEIGNEETVTRNVKKRIRLASVFERRS
jgi:hypothetical protein